VKFFCDISSQGIIFSI